MGMMIVKTGDEQAAPGVDDRHVLETGHGIYRLNTFPCDKNVSPAGSTAGQEQFSIDDESSRSGPGQT